MNKVYKLIWSKVKNCYVVASELAKSHTKAPASGVISHTIVAGILACILSCGVVAPVWAAAYSAGGGNASGTDAVSIGSSSVASGDTSLALGTYAKAYGQRSVAIRGVAGDSTNSDISRAIAIGGTSKGDYSVAIGFDSYAYGTQSLSLMPYSYAYGSYNVAIGRGTAGNSLDNPTSYSIAVGYNSVSSADASLAMGFSAKATNSYSVSLGGEAQATGAYSTAVGGSNTANNRVVAAGTSSLALGYDSKAYGNNSIAIGGGFAGASYSTSAPTSTKTLDISIGYKSVASGGSSIAIGYGAHSKASSSLALGSDSVASANNTVSFGHIIGDSYTRPNSGDNGLYTDNLFRRLTNVANGTGDHDAVTYGQLKSYVSANAGSYTLPVATSSALGGVKVGSNITNTSGTISLTKANVTTALGYTPPTTDTNTTYDSMSASELTTGTATTARSVSAKTISDYVVGKVSTETTARSTADTALGNRIGTISSDGNYIKKSDTNDVSANLLVLDTAIKLVNTSATTSITNLQSADTTLSNRIGTIDSDGSYIKKTDTNDVSANLVALDNAVVERTANFGVNVADNTNDNFDGSGASGTNAIAIGHNAVASAEDGIAIGTGNQVTGTHSGAIGDPNIVNADSSYIVGNNSTVATGAENSFIFGNNSTASNAGSLIFGSNASSTGTNGVVVGNYAKVSATDAVAVGQNASASANGAVAIGKNSVSAEANTVSLGHKATDINPATGSAYGDTVTRKISNVANGTVATDVATVGQTIELVAGDNIAVASAGTNATGQQKYSISVSADNDFVQYDYADHETITLTGPTGTGTKITGLADGRLSASSTDAVTGAQLYETNQDVSGLSDDLTSLTATVGSIQTTVNTLGTNYTTMNSTLNTVKNNVDTGFNVTVEGALAKTVNPTSNYIDFKAGDGITVANDNGAVKISVNGDGVIASGDTGAVTGDVAYTELRPADGNYIAQTNTTAANLTALDSQLKTTTDNLATEVTNRTNADTALGDRIGSVVSDGNYIKASATKNVSENLGLLDTQVKANADAIAQETTDRQTAITNEATARADADTALGNRIDALSGNAVHYDGDAKTKVTLKGSGGTTIDNVKDGTLSASSKEAVNGSQLYTTNQALAQEVTDRTTAVSNEATARSTEDTNLSNRIGSVSANGNYIKASSAKNVAENLGLLDTAVKANANAIAQEVTDRGTAIANEVTARQNADTALSDRIDALSGNAVHYDSDAKTKVTLEGTGGTTIDNVKDGTLSATSKEAVNGSQLYTTNTNLANEISARESADTTLQTNITNETTARQSADTALQGNIDAEASARSAGDTALTNKIGSIVEDGNYIGKDDTVFANLSALDTNLKATADALATETTNRTNADNTLQSNIEAETTAREQAIATLTANMGTLSGNAVQYDDAEKSKVTLGGGETGTTIDNVKDGTLSATSKEAVNGSQLYTTNQNLASEVSARQSADTTLQANITAEETARTTADTTLQGNIDAEASARTTADTTLQSNIDTEASVRASADTALQNSINTLDGVAVKYDSAETKAKITLAGAEGTTIDNLKDGTLSATSKEAVTGKQLFETNTALSAETTARENADTALQTNLGAEITARTNADTAINTRIDNLTVDYEQAVTALGVRVDNEVTARQNADTELSDRIGAITEDKNYIKASVQKNISENLEILDSALKTTNDTVASNKTAIEGALADEVTARENADTALSDRITALSENAVHYDGDTKVKITLEGTDGTTIDNVKDGTLSATSKEAVNGSQLYITNQALAQEVTDRTTAVFNEATARADADTALSNRIGTIATDGSYIKSSTEKNVSENLGLLDTNLARVDAGLTQEIADRTQAVSDEATARQNADTELGNRITTLSGNAVHYDGDAKTKITLEGTGGTTIDNVKAGTLSADSMEAVNGAQLHATNEALATEVTDRTNAINSEATARQNADTALQNSINVLDGIGVKYDNAETKAKITLQGAEGTTIDNVKDATLSANSKEAVTGSQLFTTNTNLANETSARESADTTLQTNITNEATAREEADTALGARIDTEIADRQTAITNLTNSITQLGGNAVQYDGEEKTKVTLGGGETGTTIDNVKAGTLSVDSKEAVNGGQLYTTNQNLATEISNRESAEATLQGNIDAEVTARETADTTLQTNITNESTARTEADTALGNRIDTEATARESADIALSNRIGTIAEDGNYISTTNTIYQNMSALDTGLKATNDAIDSMQTDTDTKLDTKVNVNASNIGTNASVNNSELWGMALGDGAIAPGNYKLLTGDTVYSEVRPSSDGTIVRSNNTVGANLLALDATIASMGGSLGNAVMYDSIELDTVTFGGNRGTTLANVKAGAVTRTSMEAINGSQLWSVEQDIDGFASDISKNTRSIRTLNSSVTNALSSVASVNELVNTINDVKADASLNNLTTDGRQVITNAAINAVQEYMASQGSGNTNTTNNTNSTNNVGTLNTTSPMSVSIPRTLSVSTPIASTSVDTGDTGTVGTTGNTGDAGTVGSAPTTGLRLMATNPASGTANYVVYDDANATKITLEGDVGTGTKITNLADGRLSASSTDAVTGAQLYETNQEISAMQDTIATANATSAQTQTAVTQLNNRVVAMESTVNTTKTQVETGFNVTVDGAKVKSVTPNSNSINFVAGDGVNISNDNGSVKFAINTNGTVVAGDTGLVSGGTVFNEVRVSADGNYIAKDNTTAQNLTALDTAVKTNSDAVSDLQTAVTSLATGAGITDDVVDVLTAKLGDGTVSADSTGLVSGKTLYDEVRVEEDGDVVKSDKTTAENLKALETALTGVRNGAPRYDNDEKTSITLGDGTTPVVMHNVADGNVAEGSRDAVTGNQLWQTNQTIADEATSREEADTALSNRIGEVQENGNTIQKDKNVSENLSLLDNAVKANADAVEAVRSDLSDVKGTIAGVQKTVAGVQEEVAGVKSDIVDIQTASNIDADKWAEKLGTGKAEQGDKNLVNGDTLYNTIQDIHTEIENRSVHGVSINSVDENDTNYDSKGATGDNAMALGVSAGATGEDGIAIGHSSKADGKQSIAIGTGNQVTGDHSGAFGDPNNVSGTGSYAIGNDNTISGNNTFVVGNNVTNASGNNSIVLGAGSDGSQDNVVSVGAEGAERKIIHVADGDVSKNSKEAVNGGQLFKVQKDLQDAQGIDVDKWSAKLGTGEVAEGDSKLVTGGTVFNAIKGIDIINSDATTGEIRIGGTASYDGIDTINVAKSDGTGRTITGVVTNPNDASSVANVGYVDAISQNIVDATNNALNGLNNKANKIGANAAAMASLEAPPMDGDEKWAFSAAVGHYEGETAGAVGAFYKPQDNVIMNVRGSFGNDENMIGAGVGIALQRGASTGITKAKLAKAVNNQAQVIEQLKAEQKAKDEKYEAQLQADRAEIAELKAVVAQLVADKKADK